MKKPLVISNKNNNNNKDKKDKIPVPSDWRSTKAYLYKSWNYKTFGKHSSQATAILISCMTVYKGWEGHYFNFIGTDQDSNMDLKVYDNYHYNYHHDNIAADDVSALYAHVLLLAMTHRFFDDAEPDLYFRSILKYAHKETRDKTIPVPINWIRWIKPQMDTLPKLKNSIMKFLLASPDTKCKNIVNELMGAEMTTFKAAINFTYEAPLTAAHTQKYIIEEMLMLKRCLSRMRHLTPEERELVCLLYPGKYIPPVQLFPNIAFCTVYQYKEGEGYADLIDCPHKDELKELVRSKLRVPIHFHEYANHERRMLREIGVTEYYGSYFEGNEALLVDHKATPSVLDKVKRIVSEIRKPHLEFITIF